MAAQQILVLFVQVRILVGQLRKPDFTSGFLFLRINPKFLLFYTKISPIKRAFRFMKSGKPQVLEKYRLLFKHKYVHKGSLRFHNRSRTTLICFTIKVKIPVPFCSVAKPKRMSSPYLFIAQLYPFVRGRFNAFIVQ